MPWRSIIMVLAAVSLVGCSETAPPPTAAPAQTAAEPAAAATASAAPVQMVNGFPTIPEGAAYTLYCLTISTPTHIPDSDRLKEQVIIKTGLRDWYVIHGEGQSILYYGFYKTFSDSSQPLEKQRAQGDRLAISQLRDNNGDTPFAGCGFQPISSPDPDAPPEWDLRNAPGFWALNIASYTGSPERKKYAVDAVRAARAQGIQAYYYHGKAVSSVYIGTWPREAVKEQDTNTAHSDDPNKAVIVLSEPLPPGFNTTNIFTKDGKPAKVFAPKIEIQDPQLLATIRQYPANVVNGEIHLRKVQTSKGVEERPDPSFLVIIPHDPSSDAADPNAAAPTQPPG